MALCLGGGELGMESARYRWLSQGAMGKPLTSSSGSSSHSCCVMMGNSLTGDGSFPPESRRIPEAHATLPPSVGHGELPEK